MLIPDVPGAAARTPAAALDAADGAELDHLSRTGRGGAHAHVSPVHGRPMAAGAGAGAAGVGAGAAGAHEAPHAAALSHTASAHVLSDAGARLASCDSVRGWSRRR